MTLAACSKYVAVAAQTQATISWDATLGFDAQYICNIFQFVSTRQYNTSACGLLTAGKCDYNLRVKAGDVISLAEPTGCHVRDVPDDYVGGCDCC